MQYCQRSERLESRQKYFDEILTDPIAAFKRFQVRYVALPAKTKKPEYLSTGWRLLQDGSHWQIWEFENQQRA